MTPSEFWGSTMHEFLLEMQARVPETGSGPEVFAGGLTLGQLDDLQEWARE